MNDIIIDLEKLKDPCFYNEPINIIKEDLNWALDSYKGIYLIRAVEKTIAVLIKDGKTLLIRGNRDITDFN